MIPTLALQRTATHPPTFRYIPARVANKLQEPDTNNGNSRQNRSRRMNTRLGHGQLLPPLSNAPQHATCGNTQHSTHGHCNNFQCKPQSQPQTHTQVRAHTTLSTLNWVPTRRPLHCYPHQPLLHAASSAFNTWSGTLLRHRYSLTHSMCDRTWRAPARDNACLRTHNMHPSRCYCRRPHRPQAGGRAAQRRQLKRKKPVPCMKSVRRAAGRQC